MGLTLYDKIEDYLMDWNPGSHRRFLRRYTALISHALHVTGNLPTKEKSLGICLRACFDGKRVVEFGCRNGDFPRFLQDHGAIVAASTGSKYYNTANVWLRDKAILVEANAENAGGKLKGLSLIFSSL